MMLDDKVFELFRDKRATALAGGGEDKVRARHEHGQMTARERLATLFQ